jgi:hypothetical protein
VDGVERLGEALVVVSGKEVFLALEGEGSCMWKDLVLSKSLIYLMPVEVTVLVLTYVITCNSGHLTMDMLDSWRVGIDRLPDFDREMLSLSTEIAMEKLIDYVPQGCLDIICR